MNIYTFEVTATLTKQVSIDAESLEDAQQKMSGLSTLLLTTGIQFPMVKELKYTRIA